MGLELAAPPPSTVAGEGAQALQSHLPVTGVLKWEIRESALGSALEGAPRNQGALPREARDLISKIRSCTVRSDLKNKAFSAVFCLFLRSDLTVQDRILEIRSLASLGGGAPESAKGDWECCRECSRGCSSC